MIAAASHSQHQSDGASGEQRTPPLAFGARSELEHLQGLVGLLDRLATAADVAETALVLEEGLTRLLSGSHGYLLLTDEAENGASHRIAWGEHRALAQLAETERRASVKHGGLRTAPLRCEVADVPADAVHQVQIALPGTWVGRLHVCSASEAALDPGLVSFLRPLTNSLRLALCNLHERLWLREQAMRDGLTGLYNRRFIDDALARELARARREERLVSVLMLDLDHFKQFNDSYLHDAGDAALRNLGQLLRTSVRQGDLACRMGGEEFAVVLPGAGAPEAEMRAEVIRDRVAKSRLEVNGVELSSPTVSIGVATFPAHGETPHRLLRTADKALYTAKARGRDCVVVATGPEESGAFFSLKG